MTEERQNSSEIAIHQIDQELPSITPGVEKILHLKIQNDGEREQTITLRVVAPDFPAGSTRIIDWTDGTAVFPTQPELAKVAILLPTRPALPPAGTYPLEIHASSGGQELANTRINMSVEITAQFEVTLRDIAQNGQKADLQLHIQNNSNAPLKMGLGNAEPASQLMFKLDSSEIPPAKPGQAKVTVQPKAPVTQERTDEVQMWLKASAVDKDGKEHPAPERPDHHLSAAITWKPLGPALSLSVVAPLPTKLLPGDSSVLKVKLKNNRDEVHAVRLTVDGDGSNWFVPPSKPVKMGAHGEQEVEIPLKVPTERHQALAGNYALEVQAVSQTNPQVQADAPLTMTVQHFGEATITPELHAIPDDQTVEYQLHIENDTNGRLTLSRSASQTDTLHEFTLDPAKIEVSPKETGKTMHLTVKRAKAIGGTDKFTLAMRLEFHRLKDNPATDVQHVSADWPQPPQLTITQPREQEHVPREVTLRGTFQNVPIGMHMWSYVYAPIASKYWLTRVSTDDPGGIWEAQNVVVGSTDDFGESFTLGVILANSAANARLEKQSDGFAELPDGVQKFHKITVLRELRLDDAIPEMVAYQTRDFRGYRHELKGSDTYVSLVNDKGKWVIDQSFIIKSGLWCIWPSGSWETFEILGPGNYENKEVCRCRAIRTQGITLFEGHYFSGKMINLTRSSPDLRLYDFNDKDSSAYVSTGNWYLYEHVNYDGKRWIVKEGEVYKSFQKDVNNLISSVL